MNFEAILEKCQKRAMHYAQMRVPQSWGRETLEAEYREQVVREFIDCISSIPYVGVTAIPAALDFLKPET